MAQATVGIDYEAKKQIADLIALTNNLQNSIGVINSNIGQVAGSMNALRTEFEAFRNDQTKAQAINRATTELVRVRQELEQKFSNYSVVRETMLGVLQATDLALVKKETISRVSEELMLSTPEYWLAPCLVAVAAWIGNDRDLAERAIREAVRRDEAKTALTMALICRRNERQQTCYEWLSIYFSHQDSSNFSESTLMYIDAYVNGIFGTDEKHICDDYINKWMNEVKGNSSNIETTQEQIWKDYCEGFSYEISGQFPDLKGNVLEYQQIDDYVRRINSVEPIAKNFNGISKTEVNTETLKENIDKRLLQLIGRYDVKEEALKGEEHYYDLVKKLGGNEQKAMEIIAREEQAKREHTLNLVEQMTNVITTSDDVMPSMKKTAVSFLSGYIKKGFRTYIDEKKSDFPKVITLDINGWSAQVESGDEATTLCADYEREMIGRRDKEINNATSKKSKLFLGGAIASAVLCLLFMVSGGVFFGLVFGAVAVTAFVLSNKSKKEMNDTISKINDTYTEYISDGKMKIQNVCSQWKSAKNVVEEFESRPIETIIA